MSGHALCARVRNNAVLKRLALPAMDAVVWDALNNGVPADEPHTRVCESSCRAGSWSRSRRVGQVVVERPGELFPRTFWLLTSISSGEMSGEDLLALYRKRGKAEGHRHLGELMSVVGPALSSTSRRNSHYRDKEISKREKGVDAFACNQCACCSRLRLPDHARPPRPVGARDQHPLEPAAPRRPRASHPRALHRIGPPDHDDHRRRLGALAHARLRACDPARALRIAGPHSHADPFPGPCGLHCAEVSPRAENRPSAPGELRISTPEPSRTAPKTPFGGPPVLPKPRQPPRLLSMSKFMNKAGSVVRIPYPALHRCQP